MEAPDEASLVADLRAGRPDAVEELSRQYGAFLYNLALRILGSSADAEDVVQETLVRAWTSLPASGPLRLRAWLATVATRLALNQLRWRRRHPAEPLEPSREGDMAPAPLVADPHPLSDPYRAVAAHGSEEQAMEALGALPGSLRAAMVLRALHGFDYAQIGQALGCSAGAARVKVHRARQRCRETLVGPAAAVALGPECAAYRGRIDAWMEGGLAPDEAAAVAAHVAGCLLCQQVRDREETARSAWALVPWLPWTLHAAPGLPPRPVGPLGQLSWSLRHHLDPRHLLLGEAARQGAAVVAAAAVVAGGSYGAVRATRAPGPPPRAPVVAARPHTAPASPRALARLRPPGAFRRIPLASLPLSVAAYPPRVAAGRTQTLTARLPAPVDDGTVVWGGAGGRAAAFPRRTCRPHAGSCSVAWQADSPGRWRVTASWSGDARYRPVSAALDLVVLPAGGGASTRAGPPAPPSETTLPLSLSISPRPAAVGDREALRAVLGAPVGDGSVVWTGAGPGGAQLTRLACQPAGGSCAVDWRPPRAGLWSVTAVWSGDSRHRPVSRAMGVAVVRHRATLQLAVAPDPSPRGQTVTVTGLLNPAVGDGTVTVRARGPGGAGRPVGSCTPASGVCALPWAPPAAGTWAVAASWSGDAEYAPASGRTRLTVLSAPPPARQPVSLDLAASPNPVPAGSTLTLTASLGQPVSDGTVTFGGSGPGGASLPSAACTPVQGSCSQSVDPAAAGTWSVTASWSGDAGYASASAGTQVVVQAPPPTSYTYSGTWQGHPVTLNLVPNETVEALPDAQLVGQLSGFETPDPYYRCLDGESIDVWKAPQEFPGDLVVHNGDMGTQCVYGTWTFPAPPPAAYTYTCTWNGTAENLSHVANVTVEGLADAKVVGACDNFQTDDPRYAALNGEDINTWTAPNEFPGAYVVHNGDMGSQSVYGTWTFPGP